MSDKPKNFPLPLAAVVSPSAKRQVLSQKTPSPQQSKPVPQIATPQTATRNAAGIVKNTSGWQPNANKVVLNKSTGASNASKALPHPARQDAGNAEQVRIDPLASEPIRRAMVARVAKQGVKDELVLQAMCVVQRHLFMEPGLVGQAYIDASIPIGHQQTISQPYIVARMIELMRNGRALKRVLEIGTGCGYQAAVLSCIAQEVYSIERIKPLHELAKANLRPMRIGNIRLHYGDGMLGLPQVAPFDGIILAAAGLEVPPGLLEQLAIGGRLIAPVGAKQQVLHLIERISKSEWQSQTLENCHFVPLCSGVI